MLTSLINYCQLRIVITMKKKSLFIVRAKNAFVMMR